MKNKIKSIVKRVVSSAAAAALMLSTAVSAFGAEFEYDWFADDMPRITQYFAPNTANGGIGRLTSENKLCAFKEKNEKYYALCVLPGTNFDEDYQNIDGVMVIPHMEEGEYWEEWYRDDGGAWQKDLSREQKRYVGLVTFYGYPNASSDISYFYATQLLTWEIVLGYRTCIIGDSSKFADTYNGIKLKNYIACSSAKKSAIKMAYDDIENKVKLHYTVPSKMYDKKETAESNPLMMTYDWKTLKYSASFNVENKYLDKSLSYFKDLVSDIKAQGYEVETKRGSSSTKLTVSCKTAPTGKKTVSTIRYNKDIKSGCEAQIYKRYGNQTLLKGTPRPDYNSAYITFEVQDQPNIWVDKQYKSENGLLTDVELDNALEQTRFRIRKTVNNVYHYVVADYNADKNMYVFNSFTTDVNSATSFHTLGTKNGTTGRFAVLNLPSKKDAAVSYKIEEIASANGYGTTSAVFQVPPYTDNSTTTIKLINNGASYGSADLTKEMLDENGNAYDLSDYNTAKEMQNSYKTTAFVVAVMTNDGLRYLTSSALNPISPDYMPGHVLAGTDAEKFSYNDGKYYAWVTQTGNNQEVEFNSSALTDDISNAYLIYPGWNITESEETFTVGEYFGGIHLETVPCDADGNIIPMMFIEVGHAENFGYRENDNVNAVSISNISNLSKTAFSNFKGYVTFPEGTTCKDVSNTYVLSAESVYPAVSLATDKESGQYRYADGSIENQYFHFGIEVIKTDSETQLPLENAVFGLFSEKDNIDSLIDTATSGSDGVAAFSLSLKANTKYYIHEIEAPAGYAADPEWYEIISAPDIERNIIINSYVGKLSKDIVNEPYKLDLSIIKTDEEYNIPVSGAKFDIITNQNLTEKETQKICDEEYANKAYNEGDIIGKLITNEDGEAEYYGLPLGGVDPFNPDEFKYSYTLVETFTPEPYVFDTTPYVVKPSFTDISAEKTAEKSMALAMKTTDITNPMQKVDLTVIKKSDQNAPLEGVKFDLYAAEDIIVNGTTLFAVDTLIGSLSPTDAEGKAYSSYLVDCTDENALGDKIEKILPIYAGFKYKLVEDPTSVPEYYEPLTEPIEIFVQYGGMEISTIELTKTVVNYEKSGSIQIQKTTEGMLNLDGIGFTLEGTSDAGTEVSVSAVTDENGIALFEHIPLGTYTITEDGETTPYAYLTADPVEVKVFYAQTTTKEIFNDEKKGSIQVKKTTEGMLNLDGIDFVLSGTSESGREISITATTDINGIAEFTNIPIGTYTITEDGETTPYAYLTADPVKVEVFYAEETTVDIFNEEKTGTFEVHKTTEGMTDLEGICFVLSGTSDSGREISITAVTDKNGIAVFEKIPIGTYTITEEKSSVPAGYLVADVETVEVYYAQTTTAEIFNDTTKIKVSKQDITTGKELPGAHLQVIDKDGKIIEEWISTNEPHMIEGKLKAGEEYTLRETIAPEGYNIATDIKFTVAEDGSVQTVVMKDEHIPDTPKTPETPNSPPTDTPPATGSAAGISIILGAVCILFFAKKKSMNN